MNKTQLKNFAIQSRRQLIDQVKIKTLMYGIDEKNDLEIHEQFGQLMINDKPYPLYMKPAFNSLKNQLKQKGYKQLVEEVAYTWFNRIIAIRYMEVHDYLPEKVNVLSSSIGRVDPDILFEYETMDLPVKQEEIRELLHVGDTEGAFRKLFIAQCNTLNGILPFLFEQIQDYTELLLPDFLLDAESVIKVLVQNDELTNSFDEIEVIGWLYQYYIAEEKDRVFTQKSKYKKEEIPFATQLFTPKWIVQYMVQNSLGRYWTEAHREDEDLISNWEYFIKHEEEDFYEKIASYVNKELRVEDIKLLDPAMGSGHILVYAFEVFHQIYEKCGYPERDIPRLIIENNLYGLDIDDRAYQLAAFAVVMKATSYSRRFLRSVEREGIHLNLEPIQETNHISDSVIAYIAQEDEGERYIQVKAFFDQYHNAKIYGSLINIRESDFTFIEDRIEYIQNNPVDDLLYIEHHEITNELLPSLIQQTKIMRNEYDVVVMNPPYMGSGKMSEEISDFLKKNYPNSKVDLFAAFMDNSFSLKINGIRAMVTMESWMFLNSFIALRKNLLSSQTIIDMIHMPYEGKGKTSLGINFGTVSFICKNSYIESLSGIYQCIRYNDIDEFGVPRLFPTKNDKYNIINQEKFNLIPDSRITYWATDEIISGFQNNDSIGDYLDGGNGMTTGVNEQYLRFWYEVEFTKIKFNAKNADDAINSKMKWFPYIKGGAFNKWYGNLEYVINWENNGNEIRNNNRSFLRNEKWYFKEGLSWSKVTSGKFSVRYTPSGCLFDVGGLSLFSKGDYDIKDFIGYLNSDIAENFISSLSQSMNYESGSIKSIPYIFKKDEIVDEYISNVTAYSKYLWDKNETSWDFKINPLINFKKNLKNAYFTYAEKIVNIYNEIESIEKMLDNIYKERFQLNLLVNKKEKIVNINIEVETIKLLAYFIGCVVGRYSLDRDGLVYGGGEWDESNYSTFKPNQNCIIHFTDSVYFENDIITRLREFLSVAFSPDTVDENIEWLAEALEMKKGEDAEARLRRYFLDEFFVDHCKMYQKRPIYWLVDSGKQKGLRTLIYMHCYQPDTMATIRFEYLQEVQAKYQNEITDLENRLVNPNLSASEKKKLTAEKTSFEKKIDELREFDKRLAEIANGEIEIDLDDGVKVNYEKFYRGGKGVLAKIK
ncbi:BREX-1 system adenine-specific DNA-methyltransferase PglX [Exiguobacterium undae]|uniref:BREX-1 system adenine-specific DNA-methyltransferase PglX n=1 Tax=Exiguobacterium undae TaxID=169177 RepID=UPI00047EAF4B|nr:BREX-1 system adenine-specific DNA-methyltransferase PglX [Exiguobacterium undae]